MKSIVLQNKKLSALNPLGVILLVPNLIGYVRIILLFIALPLTFICPLATFLLVAISGNLDILDGYIARKLNQESKIGQVLDYATDRAADVIIFMILAMSFPKAWSFFCAVLMLDIFSHICQVYTNLFLKLENHKSASKEQGFWLRAYYTKRPVMGFACISYGMWLGVLYLYHSYHYPWILFLSFIFLPGFIFKTIIHALQIVSVFKVIARVDSQDSLANASASFKKL